MASTPEESRSSRRWLRRILMGGGIVVLLVVGLGYAWTFTPSYSLYRIRQALETHDYALFTQYVDVDSVLDHAIDDFTSQGKKDPDELPLRGALGNLLRKGPLKDFAQGVHAVVKAGLDIAVEQAVKNPESQLPEIPASALLATLWVGRADGDTVRFPLKVKKGDRIEVRARQTPAGRWRVVEVENLPALLPTLKSRLAAKRAAPPKEEREENNGEPIEP
ncbi:MAG: DUF2939 domain-containing protein [Deltaproteobacteria bacterium]|nr:DUF2939 domain-containing protein [Deltaproteobacteria bacterium]